MIAFGIRVAVHRYNDTLLEAASICAISQIVNLASRIGLWPKVCIVSQTGRFRPTQGETMKLISTCIIAALTFGSLGCGTGTSTAPSKDPNKPNADRKLKVTVPNSETVTQDRTEEVDISISRDHFSGPVTIDFRSLPSGVEVATQDLVIPADKTSLKVTLKASATAQPVKDHAVTVGAKAKEEKELPEAVATFKLDVKSK